MCPFPIDPDARKRLLEAQRAESEALKAVELKARARDRAQRALDTASTELNDAKVTLIECSGLSRAALLLDEEEASLRRTQRERSDASGGAKGLVHEHR